MLVGHSLGGLYIRLFATRFRELVAGLVFVDCRRPQWGEVLSETFRELAEPPEFREKMLSEMDVIRPIYESAMSTGPYDDLPIAVMTADPDQIMSERLAQGVPEAIATAVAAELAESRAEMAALSTNSIVHVLDGTGHFIPRDAPGSVAEMTMEVVNSARRRSLN